MSATESNDPRDWFAKAEKDRSAAILILSDPGLADIACYHAQQCAEKYLKGHLKRRAVPFRWAHDLTYLVDLCDKAEKQPGTFAGLRDDAEWLTRAADASRYPGDGVPASSADDARKALAFADRIRALVLAAA